LHYTDLAVEISIACPTMYIIRSEHPEALPLEFRRGRCVGEYWSGHSINDGLEVPEIASDLWIRGCPVRARAMPEVDEHGSLEIE
jgi:hypothetical protein